MDVQQFGHFDVLLIADGSGTSIGKPCGWTCFLFQKGQQEPIELTGGYSSGTNNFAELIPFVHGLWHFHGTRRGNSKKVTRAILVSDSEVTVRCANGEYARNANLPIWAAIDWFSENGYRLHWRHIPRNSVEVHAKADASSKQIRHVFESMSTAKDVSKNERTKESTRTVCDGV
jgi:ribonuclease HI